MVCFGHAKVKAKNRQGVWLMLSVMGTIWQR